MVDQFIAPWWVSLPEPVIFFLLTIPPILVWVVAYLIQRLHSTPILYPMVGLTLMVPCYMCLPWDTPLSWALMGIAVVMTPLCGKILMEGG